MATLGMHEIAGLIAPFYGEADDTLLRQLSTYLDLLVRWNARTNLTAVHDPEAMLRVHFGESLFAARHLPEGAKTLLDVGSGAGFPGLPIQLARPALRVTLAESQGKKASFLREVVRTLDMETEVWAARVEIMPADRLFDVVTMRAVDNREAALEAAWRRVAEGGMLAHLTSASAAGEGIPIPGSDRRVLSLRRCR